MKKINKLLYIITFICLYAGVALVSTLHAVQFFQISNVTWIAILLAICFELGQATVLFSILTTKEERGKFMPWALMCLLTLVQIIGNVFACYKYINLNSLSELKYFKDPIFVWMQLPDDQATVILTYIASAILPLVALAMTAMITSFLNNSEDNNIKENKDEQDIRPQTEEIVQNEQQTEVENEKKSRGGIKEGNDVKNVQVEDNNIKDNIKDNNINNDQEDNIKEDEEDHVEDNTLYKKSHFIG